VAAGGRGFRHTMLRGVLTQSCHCSGGKPQGCYRCMHGIRRPQFSWMHVNWNSDGSTAFVNRRTIASVSGSLALFGLRLQNGPDLYRAIGARMSWGQSAKHMLDVCVSMWTPSRTFEGCRVISATALQRCTHCVVKYWCTHGIWPYRQTHCVKPYAGTASCVHP
jgi:hypothetical protein